MPLGNESPVACGGSERTVTGPHRKVVKQVYVGMLEPDETIDALSEAKLLSHLNHPNILMFHEAFTFDQFVCIVTEYCEVSVEQRSGLTFDSVRLCGFS